MAAATPKFIDVVVKVDGSDKQYAIMTGDKRIGFPSEYLLGDDERYKRFAECIFGMTVKRSEWKGTGTSARKLNNLNRIMALVAKESEVGKNKNWKRWEHDFYLQEIKTEEENSESDDDDEKETKDDCDTLKLMLELGNSKNDGLGKLSAVYDAVGGGGDPDTNYDLFGNPL